MPLDEAEFDRAMARFAPFERRPRIAVAVSGGSDSVCLAELARLWVRQRDGEIRAFVVDHGLRPGSAVECADVARSLASLGIPGQVLHWRHADIDRAIQEQARAARYTLLDRAVTDWNCLHLLIAHHADDQAETVAMRLLRGSGIVGMSGMPAIAERTGLRLLRPLLAIPKARLIATLRHRGIGWLDDPSNRNPRFMRARLRADPTPSMACDPCARQRLDERAAAFLAGSARLDPARCVSFGRSAFRLLEPSLARHVLRGILAPLADRQYPAATASLSRLQLTLSSDRNGAMTLGGCIVRFGGRLVRIRPEAALPLPWRPPISIAPAPFGAPSGAFDLASPGR